MTLLLQKKVNIYAGDVIVDILAELTGYGQAINCRTRLDFNGSKLRNETRTAHAFDVTIISAFEELGIPYSRLFSLFLFLDSQQWLICNIMGKFFMHWF